MHIQRVNSNYTQPSFKAARLNILATADNHGHLVSMPVLMTAIEENKKDIFQKAEEKSTQNVFAIAGDFFINPMVKNLLTKPDKTNGDIQYEFLLKLIETAHKTSGESSNFDTIFTLGNHCLEGGDRWILDKLKSAPLTTIETNIKLKKSPLIKSQIKDNNIVSQKIYEIPDDKNPEIKNHALFLGVTIPRDKFNSRVLEGTQFYDHTSKNDLLLEKEDLKKTFKVLNYHVKTFKEKYPDGVVIVLSHTGNPISAMIAEEVNDINIILNGHDHKKTDILLNKTGIVSLGKNNDIIKSINMLFNDNGKLTGTAIQTYNTREYNEIALENKELQKFVQTNIEKDIEPLIKYDENVEMMKFSKKVRYENCDWVNYITDSVKDAVKIAYPSVDIVGIPSEIFRGGLKDNTKQKEFNNLDLIKLFAGANENLSNLKIGTITGEELYALALENTMNNLQNPKRSGMIQWSDLQVNRTLINNIINNESSEELSSAFKFRNPESGEFEPVDLNKEYTIVLPDKYLLKDKENVRVPSTVLKKFTCISGNYNSYFREYLDLNDFNFELDGKCREQRIL